MMFVSEDVLPKYGFLKTYIMIVTTKKDYVTVDPDDDDAGFRYNCRVKIIAQFKQDFHNKRFSLQDQGKCDEIDTLQERTIFWLKNFDMGTPTC